MTNDQHCIVNANVTMTIKASKRFFTKVGQIQLFQHALDDSKFLQLIRKYKIVQNRV